MEFPAIASPIGAVEYDRCARPRSSPNWAATWLELGPNAPCLPPRLRDKMSGSRRSHHPFRFRFGLAENCLPTASGFSHRATRRVEGGKMNRRDFTRNLAGAA